MSADDDGTPGQQVALDGTDPERAVPVDRGLVAAAAGTISAMATKAADGDLDADPEALIDLAADLSGTLDRDDVPTEQITEWGDDRDTEERGAE